MLEDDRSIDEIDIMAANQNESVQINDSRKRTTERDSFAHSFTEKRNKTSSSKTFTFTLVKYNSKCLQINLF